jgi:hypothetical protein
LECLGEERRGRWVEGVFGGFGKGEGGGGRGGVGGGRGLVGRGDREVLERFGDEGRGGVGIEGLKLDNSTQIWPENLGMSEKSQKPASFGNISCQVSLNMYNDEMHM